MRTAREPGRFFDPFGGGAELDRIEARALFERLTRGQVDWQDEYLEPTPAEHIVIRMLNNLRAIFQTRSDDLRLGLVMQMRAQIPQLAVAEDAEIAVASAIFN